MILNGVPAVTVLRVVKEKGFCADAMPAKKAAARREREYCILTSLSMPLPVLICLKIEDR